VEVIAPLVEVDQLFLVLYKEMYYRHLYSINGGINVTLTDRVESFQNYFNLFAYILKNKVEKIDLYLPYQWIWDIVDEFIWQYVDYARYKSKLARVRCTMKESEVEENIEFVKNHSEIWSTIYVIQTLNSLVNKSDIEKILEAEKRTGAIEVLEASGSTHFIRMLGYYAMIGLLRVHTLLGDYHGALRAIDSIDFTKRVQLYSKVVACHITLYYYSGFVFMMMRRYVDAIKFFTQLLTYINRIKNIHARSYQYDDIVKKNEQIYYLLAMTLSLCPQRYGVDEVILATLREKLGDKLVRLAQGDLDVYSEMFRYACPKFITMQTIIPSLPLPPDTPIPQGPMEAVELQRSVFLNEVQQQLVLPTIRGYLSLYSTISVSKLATFMEPMNPTLPAANAEGEAANVEEVDDVKKGKIQELLFGSYLLRLKHKTRQLVWTGGRPIEGERQSVSDVGFYIDKDIVYVQNDVSYLPRQQQQRSHAQYFVDQIRYLKPCLDTLARFHASSSAPNNY